MLNFSSLSRLACAAALLLPLGALAQAPVITATKSDGTPAATKKNPGDTVTYTNVISNTGTANATGVQFTDPDVAGSAVQMGTLKVSPIAFDDAYVGTIVSGVPMDTSVSTQFSVVTNDYVGVYNNAPGTLTITAFDAISAQGGTVSVVTSGPNIGKFSYTSAGGFTGTDSFTYTISNTGFTAVGTVTLTVAGPGVWFVNDATGNDTTGKGTMTAPYKTLTKVATVDAANQRIFVFSGAYAAGMTLESGEQLIGQGVVGTSYDTVVTGVTPGSDSSARPAIGGTKPTITDSAGNVITLANDNFIRGVTVNSTAAGFAVAGSAITNFQFGSSGANNAADTTITSSGSSSGSISLTGAAGGTVNILGVLTNSAASGRALNISGRSSGAVSVIGKVSDTGAGVLLNSNIGATINIRSANLSTTTNAAFTATGGGTVNVTAGDSDGIDNDGDGLTDEADEANVIVTTSGTALNVSNTAIGASNITFRSISSNGGTGNGIILDTTGPSGGLIVTGDGSNTTAGGNSSGGTIQSKSGADGNNTQGIGIYLNSTSNVQLRRMTISGINQNFGIRGFGVTNFTMQYCTVGSPTPSSSGSIAANLQGTNNSGIGEGAIYFGNQTDGTIGLTGTALIDNCFISGGRTDNMQVSNGGGTLNRLTITNTTFGYNFISTPAANAALTVMARRAASGNTILNSTVTGCTFVGSPGNAANFTGQEPTTSLGIAMDTIFQNNTITNNHPQNNLGGCNVTVAGFSSTTFNISNNTMRGAHGSAITLQMGAPVAGSTVATSFSGTVNNNAIGVTGVANSGSVSGNGIFLSLADNATAPKGVATIALTNNTIRNYSGNAGIYADNTGGSYDLNFTCTGNTTAEPGPFIFAGLALTAGSPSSTDDVDVFATITGNNFSAGDPSNASDIIVGVSAGASSMKLAGTGSPANNTPFASLAAVQTFLLNNNNIAGTVTSAYVDAPATFANFLGAGATNPPLPSTLLFAAQEPADAPAPAVASSIPAPVSPPVTTAAPAPAAAAISVPQPVAAGLTEAQLASLVQEALARWDASGLSAEQSAALHALQFEIADLDTLHLGFAAGKVIKISRHAAGNEWFIDPTPADDSEFADQRSATLLRAGLANATAPIADRVDLLTTLMHEMGHVLGLADRYDLKARDGIMFGYLTKGERRLPARAEAQGSALSTDATQRYLTGAINIGVLPPGKSVTITYDVIIDNPATTNTLSSQGTVSGGNFSNVLTDDLVTGGDPLLPGAADPTVTLIDLPDVTVDVIPASGLEDNGSVRTYTFTRQGSTAADMIVNFSFTGTASPASDYIVIANVGALSYTAGAATGTITIPTGSAFARFNITPTADTAVEPDETVIANVTAGSGYDVGIPGSATSTITNDDTAVSIDALPDASLFEDQTLNFSYTFRRTGVTTGTTIANFTVGGTAVFGTDYTQSGSTSFTATTGTVTFAPGEITKVVTLDPVNDNVVEGNETIILTVAAGAGYEIASPSAQTATIVDDDVTVSVSGPAPASSLEDSGTGMVYTFSRSGGSVANALTVNVTVGGTAGFTGDYSTSGFATNNLAGAATITFAGGSSTKTVTITPTVDATGEPDETVILTVAANGVPAVTGGYAVAGSPNDTATGTIVNDDTQVSVAVSPGTVGESSGTPMVYTFTRNGSTAAAQVVNFSVSGSATFTADYNASSTDVFAYSAASGTITIPVGQASASLSLTPATDAIVEANETAILTVTAGGGYVPAAGPNDVATGTITDDDVATVSIAKINDGAEGPPIVDGRFRVTQTAISSTNTTINYIVTGTATPGVGNDYTALSGSVTILAGNTTADIVVSVLADAVAGESTETVIVTFNFFGSADPDITFGSPTTATVNILAGPSPVSSSLGDVVTDNAAPGTDGTTNIGKFDLLRRGGYLAQNGDLAFTGNLLVSAGPPAVTNNDFQGIWAKDAANPLRLIARSGSIAPGTGNATFDVLPEVVAVSDDGDVSFFASLRVGTGAPAVTSSNDTGLWTTISVTGANPQPVLMAREGSALRSPSNAVITKFATGCFATSGTNAGRIMVFSGTEADGKTGVYVMTMNAGLPQAAVTTAKEGNTAPGAGGLVYDNLASGFSDTARMDQAGNYCFAARLKPTGEGIWYAPLATGVAQKVMVTGDAAPGTTTTFSRLLDTPVMGGTNNIAFHAYLAATGDNASGQRGDGIWKGVAPAAISAYTLVIRAGDTGIAGLPGGAKVGNLWTPWMTNANHLAFRGWVDVDGNGVSGNGTDVHGLYTDTSGTMTMVVKQGDVAPGMPVGATFTTMDLPVVGGVEQMAFLGTVTGGGTTAANNKGLWRQGANGGALSLVTRTGDTVSTTQGTKTIAKIDFPGTSQGGETTDHRWEQWVMDSTGRMILQLTFTDGSTSTVLAP